MNKRRKKENIPLRRTELPEETVSPLNGLHRRLQHGLEPATRRRSHFHRAEERLLQNQTLPS